MRVWSEEETAILIANKHRKFDEIATLLPNKTHRQLINKFNILGFQYRLMRAKEKAARHLALTMAGRAYLAGLTDGEGTIRIAKDPRHSRIRPSYDTRVSIANNDSELLVWLKETIGVGYISHGEYQMCNYDVKPFLVAILPYLRVKKQHALLVIEFIDLRLGRKRWDEYYTEREIEIYHEVSELNRKPQLTKRRASREEVLEFLSDNNMEMQS